MNPVPLPRDEVLDKEGKFKRPWFRYFEYVGGTVARAAQWVWGNIDFTGSRLSDIQTRPHSQLQSVLGADVTDDDATQNKHISNAQAKKFNDPVYILTNDSGRAGHLKVRTEINPADGSEYVLIEWKEIL